MAYESFYWRKIIKRDLTYLANKLNLKYEEIENKIDEHFSNVEIKIMSSAYILRKLADSNKLPDNALTRLVEISIYRRNSLEPPRPYINIEKEYDLTSKSSTKINFRKLCNQIIHSHILQVIGDEDNVFTHFWVTSDNDKNKYLYEIPLKEFIKEARLIADLQIKTLHGYFDKKRREWIYKRT